MSPMLQLIPTIDGYFILDDRLWSMPSIFLRALSADPHVQATYNHVVMRYNINGRNKRIYENERNQPSFCSKLLEKRNILCRFSHMLEYFDSGTVLKSDEKCVYEKLAAEAWKQVYHTIPNIHMDHDKAIKDALELFKQGDTGGWTVYHSDIIEKMPILDRLAIEADLERRRMRYEQFFTKHW